MTVYVKFFRLHFTSFNYWISNKRVEKMKQEIGVKLQEIAAFESKQGETLKRLAAAQEAHS
jgi:hypothetical protein